MRQRTTEAKGRRRMTGALRCFVRLGAPIMRRIPRRTKGRIDGMRIGKDAYILAHALSGKHGLVLPSVAQQLLTLARRYARVQERWCCEDMSGTPGLQEKVETQERALEERIRELAKTIPGVRGVGFGGDPRGFCTKLHLRSRRYNTMGGVEDGWGVA